MIKSTSDKHRDYCIFQHFVSTTVQNKEREEEGELED